MVALSSTGEVADFLNADQFQPSRSQFECGFWAVAVCRAMAQVGKPPTQSVAQVIAEAEAWYAQYDGSDGITNTNGMMPVQLYDLLHQVGLHYQATMTSITTVKAWLAIGYPVIIAITEVSVHDLALGDASPYPWTPGGTHIIVATGVAKDGNLLVRDTANCTDLYNPNSLRPGPRTYNAALLQLVSATVCIPPWLPRPTSATPPERAPAPLATTTWISADQEQAARSEWNSTAVLCGGSPPDYTTEIALWWQKEFRAGRFPGPPGGVEVALKTWPGAPIRVQRFFGGRCEAEGKVIRFYPYR